MALNDPDTRSAAASIMLSRINFMRMIHGGTETMRAAGTTLLPQYEKETDARYKTRLASTFALNKLLDAVQSTSAKPFATLVEYGTEDPELSEWQQDIDLRGNHLHAFAHAYFDEAILLGMAHILVDHPSTVNMPNLAAQRESGVRPFFKSIRPEDMVAIYSDRVGGRMTVNHARFLDTTLVRSGFDEKFIDKVHVLDNNGGVVTYTVYWRERVSMGTAGGTGTYTGPKSTAGSAWQKMEERVLSIPQIPLVTMFAGKREDDYLVKPVFQDLAYKQVEHWISSSDQRSILSAGRFPMLACSGVQLGDDDSGFEIGPYKILYSPDSQGRWYYVEPKGTAIESGSKDIERLEFQMGLMSLNPTVPGHRMYVPFGERQISERMVNSVVRDFALSCKDSLEQAVRYMGMWAGKDFDNVSVRMNTEWGQTEKEWKEVQLLLDAYDKGAISRRTLWYELRRRDVVDDSFDFDKEEAYVDGQERRRTMEKVAERQQLMDLVREDVLKNEGAFPFDKEAP